MWRGVEAATGAAWERTWRERRRRRWPWRRRWRQRRRRSSAAPAKTQNTHTTEGKTTSEGFERYPWWATLTSLTCCDGCGEEWMCSRLDGGEGEGLRLALEARVVKGPEVHARARRLRPATRGGGRRDQPGSELNRSVCCMSHTDALRRGRRGRYAGRLHVCWSAGRASTASAAAAASIAGAPRTARAREEALAVLAAPAAAQGSHNVSDPLPPGVYRPS